MSRAALLLLLASCAVNAERPDVAPPICHGARVFVVTPAAAATYGEPLAWAFDRWRAVLPELGAARIEEDPRPPAPAECVTPVDVEDFGDARTFGETRGGALWLARSSPLDAEGRRALLLHELGHVLFRLGHSGDPEALMFPVLHVPAEVTPADDAAARAAYAAP